jgi:hypothetical protein
MEHLQIREHLNRIRQTERALNLWRRPAGAGGGKVRADSITAAFTRADFMISNVGRLKVICLSQKESGREILV